MVSDTYSNSYSFNFTLILPHKQTTIKTTQLQASHAFIRLHARMVPETHVGSVLIPLKLNGRLQSTHGNFLYRNLLFLFLRRFSCIEIGMVQDQQHRLRRTRVDQIIKLAQTKLLHGLLQHRGRGFSHHIVLNHHATF